MCINLKMKLLIIFLLMKAIAMKPGPFKDVIYEDPKTHYKVESILDKKRGDFSSTGHTTVYDANNKKIWSSELFTGRKTIELSPDGQTIALIGSFDFGNTIQPFPNEEIIVFNNKKGLVKTIKFSDLIKDDIETLIKKYNISQKGGGWCSMADFIKNYRIDWESKNVYFKLLDDKEVHVTFK